MKTEERLRQAEIENAIRRLVPKSFTDSMVGDCILRGINSLTNGDGGEWVSKEGFTAGDIVRDYRGQYGNGTPGQPVQDKVAWNRALAAGDVRAMVANAPTT